MNPKIILTFALSLCACGPGLAIDYGDTGPWDDDAGDADSGGSETGVPVDMGGDVEIAPGETWGPCPVSGGVPTLCNDESIACVPSEGATHNVCLPIGGCPLAPYGTSHDVGWGGACYPRCVDRDDCAPGQDCVTALADGGNMCAWPV